MPSAFAVATEKAKAFGKQIIYDGTEAAVLIGLTASKKGKTIYATNGRSSSFKYKNLRIYFKGVSPRKICLGDSLTGLAIRALWQIGKEHCRAN